jgi:hypothetical protein
MEEKTEMWIDPVSYYTQQIAEACDRYLIFAVSYLGFRYHKASFNKPMSGFLGKVVRNKSM